MPHRLTKTDERPTTLSVVVALAPRVHAAVCPIADDEWAGRRGPIAREVVVTEPKPILSCAQHRVLELVDVQGYAEDVLGSGRACPYLDPRCATTS